MKSTVTREYSASRKLLWVGPLAIVSAIIANLIVRAIAVALFGVPGTFQYFQASYIISSTIIYLLLALIAFALVSRFARRPIRFYRVLALVALLVSFLIPAMALGGLLPIPDMNAHIFWTMIVMHSVSAVIVVGLLTHDFRASKYNNGGEKSL
jgi:ABC-type transport system involved in multi-copper enzyme maturation permease subunit